MNPLEQFGSMVFSDRVMRERLPKETYKALQQTIREGRGLDPNIAGVVANAMKDWAIEKGVTHFSHWFQPMTGITAEKHDSFLSPAKDGGIIIEFSGKELVRGEPDASSFPSGGLRATFEARGYTAWDPTSYAFIKEGTLCIPTAFCAYGGESLDKKTPLMRSMECINIQATRLLRLLGDTRVNRVVTTVGPEQEYFLIDKALFDKRPDLQFCGRTLFGARPPKGQELEGHYFGAIRPRVQAFMRELNEELWRLGVLAKTEHNETAPSQHELAPVYTTTNIACDHNQLTMEMMKKVATRHGLACLLHEKPFEGVNGSGKHNNWSLCTDSGQNLLDPGDDPAKNTRFLLFLVAVIHAVDEYQSMLRVSVSSAGNDCRLGAGEAPPAILSIYLGDELHSILESIEGGWFYDQKNRSEMESGVKTLAHFEKDNTDRNRTSPLAFTGNKFEFRSLGSAFSVSGPNFVLNTIVAEIIGRYADRLENCENIEKEALKLIRETVAAHRRILFNGNNYTQEWVREAERRGLLNLQSAVDALPYFVCPENIELFTKNGILTEQEIRSRYEIMLEVYAKTLHVEALTMLDMTRAQILPAVSEYGARLARNAAAKKAVNASCRMEESLAQKLAALTDALFERANDLQNAVLGAKAFEADSLACARHYRDAVLPAMREVRAVADEMEPCVDRAVWPFPSYGELLFSV